MVVDVCCNGRLVVGNVYWNCSCFAFGEAVRVGEVPLVGRGIA